MARPLIDAASQAATAGPPIAKIVDVIDHQFGLDVPDPYRWMESPTNEATGELKDWLVAQGEFAAKQFAATPHRDELYNRIRELGLGVSAVWDVDLGGTRVFYMTLPANAQLAKLAVREPDGSVRTLIDPEALSTPEVHVSLNAYNASPDGSHVGYVISKGGGERGELHVMDVKTGKDLPDVIERIWGEGSASWLPDGTSFFYSQLAEPKPGVDPMKGMVEKLHVLGTAVDKDPVVLGRTADATWKLADEEWPGLWQPTDSTWMVVSTGGAHNEARIGVAKASELDRSGASKTPWRPVADYADGVVSAWPHGDRLYLLTYKDAPNRKLLSVPLAKPVLANARVELAEDPTMKIEWISSAKDAMYVARQINGQMHLDRLAWKTGAKLEPIALPSEGWIPDVATDRRRDGLVFQVETWLHTGTYYQYDPAKKRVAPIGLASTSTADTSQMVVEETEVESGGVKIPLTIIRRKDSPGTSHPTILYAYAGYGAVEKPGFSSPRIAWVERGGIYAIAHVRGGGEKGRTWQDDGSREKKMNGVHDFIACAEFLIEHGYTTSKQLAIHGVSMGGVLIGRVLTERPDLFAAVQLSSGIVNPLRTLQAENGANQKVELGDPATEAGYKSLVEMDPYTHVVRAAYPAVVFTIGLNDHRVAPWMSAKMAARLQASTTSGKPILVRIQGDAGHGVGSTRDQGFAERADVWSFFLAQMGE